MINETIFRCVVLGLQSTEKCLFGTENLNGTGRMLGKTEQTTSMADKSCTNEFTNQRSEVGRDRVHTVTEIFSELCSIGGYRDDLVAKLMDVTNVGVGDFSTHRNLCCRLQSSFKIFREDGCKVSRGGVCSET